MGYMIAQEYPSDDEEAFKATGNLYFDDFQLDGENANVVAPLFTPQNPPPAWYTFFYGVDPGFDDPWSVALCMMDERGDIHVLESDVEARLGESEQANRIVQMAERWGIKLSRLTGVAGNDLWARKTVDGMPVDPPVQKYYTAGLDIVSTSNDVISQWQRNQIIRDYIRECKFWIYKGFNTKLIAAMSNAKHDPLPSRSKLPLHDKHSHPIFALACAVSSWPRTAVVPEQKLTPAEHREKLLTDYQTAQAKAAENMTAERDKRMLGDAKIEGQRARKPLGL